MNKIVKHRFDRNVRRRLLVERLCAREMLTADPVLSWNVAKADVLIGETFDVSLQFANHGSSTGYGPYVDVVIPNEAGDFGGVDFIAGSGSVLDFKISETTVKFDEHGLAHHPFALDASGEPSVLQSEPGSSLIVFELPFGSFTTSQPSSELQFQLAVASDARIDRSIEVVASSGFRWGSDAIDNHDQDPMVRGEDQPLLVQPSVFAVDLDYLGPENETVTGLNYERSYRATLDVAEGIVINDFSWQTQLDDIQLLQGFASQDLLQLGFALSSEDESPFGAEIVWHHRSYEGVAGPDASFIFDMVVPDTDESGEWILDPLDGGDVNAVVASQLDGFWAPTAESPELADVVAVSTNATHDLQVELLTTQQSVRITEDVNAQGLSVGDTLQYSIDFQVSDYAALENAVLQFSVPDGQKILETSAAKLTLPPGIGTHYVDVELSPTGPSQPGTSTFLAQLSQAYAAATGSGRLVGAAVAGSNDPLTGTITYDTVILDEFQGAVASNDPSIDEGDRFHTTVLLSANPVQPDSNAEAANVTTDDSGTAIGLPVSAINASVYAINGNKAANEPSISPGDLVTFRINREVRSNDIESLKLSSFLPFPIFETRTLSWLDEPELRFQADTIQIGAADSFHQVYDGKPDLEIDPDENHITLVYGSIDSEKNESTNLEVFVTLEVQDRPFADGMWLTALAESSQASSNLKKYSSTAAANVLFTRPVLSISNDPVGSDNPNASLNSNSTGGKSIHGIDAGDFVQFETVVENQGMGKYGAFDVVLSAILPEGFRIPDSGPNLQVLDANSNAIDFDGTQSNGESDFFSGGIRLTAPIESAETAGANNRVFLRYELLATETIHASDSAESVASLTHYAALPGGTNFVSGPIQATAEIAFANASLNHSVVSTDQIHTEGRKVAIGESAEYEVGIRIPEGVTRQSELTVELPRGMAIKELIGIEVDDSLKFDSGSVADIVANTTIESNGNSVRDEGRILRIPLGTIVNSDTKNANDDLIQVRYSATVLNDENVNEGKSLRPRAILRHEFGKLTKSASNLKVVEPGIHVEQDLSHAYIDARDHLTISLLVASNDSATAFDVQMETTLPVGVTYVDGSLRSNEGVAPESLSIEDDTINATWHSLGSNEVSLVEFDVTVPDAVNAGQILSGKTDVHWTSLPDSPGRISVENDLSYERTSDETSPGGPANDYSFIHETQISIAPVDLSIELAKTSEQHTVDDSVTIGERADFEVTATIPEGSHQLVFHAFDTQLDASVVVEDVRIVSVGQSLYFDSLYFDKLDEHASYHVGDDGKITIDFGRVTNRPDNLSNEDDLLIFQVSTFVADLEQASRNRTAEIAVVADFENGSQTATDSLDIVEPDIEISNTFSSDSLDALQQVEVSYVLDASAISTSDAFDIQFVQHFDRNQLQIVPGTIRVEGARLLDGNAEGDREIRIAADSLDSNREIEVQYIAVADANVTPGETLKIWSTLQYASIDGVEARTYQQTQEASIHVNSSSITGSVFVDDNQNGTREDSDRGLDSVRIFLSGVDHLGHAIEQETRTKPNGAFEFPGLRPGTYGLTQEQPGSIADGIDLAVYGNGNPQQDRVDGIVIRGGSDRAFAGYHFTESPLTWISGTVFVDANADGSLAANEEGIEDVTIYLTGLTDSGTSVEREVQTNDRGYFVFGHLEPGTYDVVEGRTHAYHDADDELGSRGGQVSNDMFSKITVGPKSPGENYNFGEYKPGTITGTIYVDYDRDGTFDRLDGVLANVPVTLSGTDDLGQAVRIDTVTDIDGNYSFNGLRPGEYDLYSVNIDGLTRSVSNLGALVQGISSLTNLGRTAHNGFEGLVLPPGGQMVSYNVGHVDDEFLRSIKGSHFEVQTTFVGTTSADRFEVVATDTGISVLVNEAAYELDASDTRSLRFLGSFGADSLTLTGSKEKEEIELRDRSARITGTWFETLVYGMEEINFHSGGYEDVARFYDTAGDESFSANPEFAQMIGRDFKNSVQGVHRVYAYASMGFDQAEFSGVTGKRDNFKGNPHESRLYNHDFYIFGRGFDEVEATATDGSDRAYLDGSAENDVLWSVPGQATLSGNGYGLNAIGYSDVLASAGNGGKDVATLVGSFGDDHYRGFPSRGVFDAGRKRVRLSHFDGVEIAGNGGQDVARLHDSHGDDHFKAAGDEAVLENSLGETILTDFDRVYAFMEAGGTDSATLYGTSSPEVFHAFPENWSLSGGNTYFFGSGFTSVEAHGDRDDKAYLHDSAFNDSLIMTDESAVLRGQRFANAAVGFGRVNASLTSGHDHAEFHDQESRSTIRMNDKRLTIFGSAFSHNVTGVKSLDAYFSSLAGRDNVDLSGPIEHEVEDREDETRSSHRLMLQLVPGAEHKRAKTSVNSLFGSRQ